MKEPSLRTKIGKVATKQILDRVFAICKEQDVTIAQLAIATGCASENRIYTLKRGKHGMNIGTLFALAIALNMKVSDLLPSNEDVMKTANLIKGPSSLTIIREQKSK